MPKKQPKKPAAKKPKASPAKASKPAAVKSAKKPAAKTAPKAKAKIKEKAKPAPAKKVVTKKVAPAKKIETKAVKPVPKVTKVEKKPLKKISIAKKQEDELDKPLIIKPGKITPFMRSQREKLQLLRDTILDSMAGVAKDTLRSRPEGNEASAFGMHQADAGSDAYDKDFALSLLSQEQDALYEIEEAMKRVDMGTYGICEMSGKPILVARLEALPFARYTVECQTELERTKRHQRSRVPVTSLFGLTDSDEEESDGEEAEESPQKPQTEE